MNGQKYVYRIAEIRTGELITKFRTVTRYYCGVPKSKDLRLHAHLPISMVQKLKIGGIYRLEDTDGEIHFAEAQCSKEYELRKLFVQMEKKEPIPEFEEYIEFEQPGYKEIHTGTRCIDFLVKDILTAIELIEEYEANQSGTHSL